MYFSIFYVFFKYLPRKKKKRGSIRLYTASTPAHGSCVFPKQSIRFSRKKTVFIKFSLAFFCHSGMLGKYFPFACRFRFTGYTGGLQFSNRASATERKVLPNGKPFY